MKKILLSVVSIFLCLSSVFAIDLPAGFVSIFALNSETDKCPYAITGGASYQFTGPGSGWDKVELYDLSNYKQLSIKLTYPIGNAGTQMYLRFASNMAVNAPILINLPASSTEYILTVPLSSYKNSENHLGVGGLVIYNGATHWSFTYAGTPSSNDVTVEYIAVSAADPTTGIASPLVDNPNAIVNVYSLTGAVIRKQVKMSEAVNGLKPGFYVINNRKICVVK